MDIVICAIIAVHNRKIKTIESLRHLYKGVPPYVKMHVVMLDDGSSDGTSEAAKVEFPNIQILTGNGNEFWNGGMRRAWQAASSRDPDFYLWINDDTLLNSSAVANLLNTSALFADQAIIVGTTYDAETGKATYGGVCRPDPLRPLRFKLVEPKDVPVAATTMNGNCVLVPRKIYSKVGLLSSKFTHGMGDFDYGLRARKAGVEIWVAPGFVGTCSRNDIKGTWQDLNLPLMERWRKVRSLKGLPPREWLVFTRRHGGNFWIISFIHSYLNVLLVSVRRSSFKAKANSRHPKVALLVNIVAPYRLPIYKALGKEFDLTIYVAGEESNRKKWIESEAQLTRIGVRVRHPFGFTLNRRVGSPNQVKDLRYLHITPGYLLNLLQDRPDAIVTNELGIRTMLALLYGKLFCKPVWVWWGGTLHTERSRGILKRLVRRFLAVNIKNWISYGKSSTEYLSSIGVPTKHVLQIQNSVDESLFNISSDPLCDTRPRPLLLYVGQMIGRKGVSYLLEGLARIQSRGYHFSLLLVGDGPEKNDLIRKSKELDLKSVNFLQSQAPEDMPSIYRSADCLIFPTLEDVWGLVVNEALWSGLPVFSSKFAGCSDEIVPKSQVFDPLDNEDLDRVLISAVNGNFESSDTSKLLTSKEISEKIASAIKKIIRA